MLIETKRGNVYTNVEIPIEKVYKKLPAVTNLSQEPNGSKLENVLSSDDIIRKVADLGRMSENSIYNNIKSESDILELIDLGLEVYGEERYIYSIEGVSVIDGKKAVILLGQSRAGKSTAAYYLKDYFKIGGDEHLLITYRDNAPYFIGGNRYSFTKPWNTKKGIVDFGEDSNLEAQIVGFITLKLNTLRDSKDKVIISREEPDHLTYTMNDLTSQKIRGVNKYLGKIDFPLPSVDSKDIAIKRIEFCKKIQKVPFIFYEGNESNLKDLIRDLMGSE